MELLVLKLLLLLGVEVDEMLDEVEVVARGDEVVVLSLFL
jgi:hypothetical protein